MHFRFESIHQWTDWIIIFSRFGCRFKYSLNFIAIECWTHKEPLEIIVHVVECSLLPVHSKHRSDVVYGRINAQINNGWCNHFCHLRSENAFSVPNSVFQLTHNALISAHTHYTLWYVLFGFNLHIANSWNYFITCSVFSVSTIIAFLDTYHVYAVLTTGERFKNSANIAIAS